MAQTQLPAAFPGRNASKAGTSGRRGDALLAAKHAGLIPPAPRWRGAGHPRPGAGRGRAACFRSGELRCVSAAHDASTQQQRKHVGATAAHDMCMHNMCMHMCMCMHMYACTCACTCCCKAAAERTTLLVVLPAAHCYCRVLVILPCPIPCPGCKKPCPHHTAKL